jgi:hypothetical protein
VLLEVSNCFGLGDGTPLLVEANPDLEEVFGSADPPAPQRLTDRNREYWAGADPETKREALVVAYLQHPHPRVQQEMFRYLGNVRHAGIVWLLLEQLADGNSITRDLAAKAIWTNLGGNGCRWAVQALADEIQGASRFPECPLGPERAIRALDGLVASAPDEASRSAIQQHADRHVIIEDRIKDVDPSSVRYVKTEQRDSGGGAQWTYEVYRAKNREHALAFLKSRRVEQEQYYVEVETPDGTFGRDMLGIYIVNLDATQ